MQAHPELATQTKLDETRAEYRLVDSTYAASDALPMLLSLIQDKIEFLGFRIQGQIERSSEEAHHLEERVRELAATRAELSQFLKSVGSTKVKVDCRIKIEVLP